MGRQGEQRAGPLPGRLLAAGVEPGHRVVDQVRAAPDLVQRHQPVVAVERGVLHTLGHHRAAQLLEPGHQLLLGGSRELQSQQPAQELEQERVEVEAAGRGRFHRGFDGPAVGVSELVTGAEVGPVHGKTGQHLAQARPQLPPGVIAVAPVALAHQGPQCGEALHLGRQLLPHDLHLRVVHDLGIVRPPPDEGVVTVAQLGHVVGVDEQAVDPVQELVARGPGHRPGPGQRLVGLQDVLDHHPGAAGGRGQPVQVAVGVAQAVDVVDPQPRHQAPLNQGLDQAVSVVEHLGVLHPDPRQRLDVEKTAVVELLAGGAPEGQAVVLALQQVVEGIGVGIDRGHLGVNRGGHVGLGVEQAPQPLVQDAAVALPLGRHVGVHDEGVGQLAVADGHGVQLLGGAPHRGPGQQLVQAAGRDRQAVVEVGDHERTVLQDQADVARLQDPAVVVAQDGHQHAAGELALGRVPVDVEVAGVGAGGPVGQHVPPPAVVPAVEGHVIGHDVEHRPQALVTQPLAQRPQALDATQLRVHTMGVDDVVAVGTAGRRLQGGREVGVGDAQGGQVVGDIGQGGEVEARVQLHPVGRPRRRHGPAPTHAESPPFPGRARAT